jgi:hypothetical protein
LQEKEIAMGGVREKSDRRGVVSSVTDARARVQFVEYFGQEAVHIS